MNDVTIVVKGDNRSKPALKEPVDDLERLKTQAKAAGVDLDGLGKEFARVSKQTDDFGQRLRGTGTFSEFLDGKLARLKADIRDLGVELNRTGDVDVLGKLNRSKGQLKAMESIKSDLANALQSGARAAVPAIENAIIDAGQAGSKTFWGAISALPPQAQAAIVAAIVATVAAASVLIGATIGGTILAGIGAAGIGAAIAGQISDPSVANALGNLKTDLGAMFKDVTSPFGPVLIRSAGAFGAMVKEMGPGLKSAFATAAPFAEKFLQGVIDLAHNALPGLETAMVAGSKILARLGESDLPKLGQAISDFFDDISSGGREGGDALSFLIGMISGTLNALGTGIVVAEAWFGIFEDIAGLVGGLATGDFGLLADRIMAMGEGSDSTSMSIRSLGGAEHGAAVAARDMASAFDDAFGKTMNVDEAATRFKVDLFGLKGALDSHSRSIDLNSAAGAHNREVILGLIQDAKRHRDAMIEQAGGANASKAAIDAANKVYEDDIQKVRGMWTAAGGAARAFDDLAGTYNVNIVTHHTDVYSSDYQQHSRGEHAHGGITGAATGGIRGALTMVGEQGRELVRLPYGSQVIPNGTTENMLAGAGAGQGRGAGGGRTVVEFLGDLDNVLAQWFMKAQRDGKVKIYSSAVVTA